VRNILSDVQGRKKEFSSWEHYLEIKFLADQLNIFVLNPHVHKHAVF
jgi:hypothetical protein